MLKADLSTHPARPSGSSIGVSSLSASSALMGLPWEFGASIPAEEDMDLTPTTPAPCRPIRAALAAGNGTTDTDGRFVRASGVSFPDTSPSPCTMKADDGGLMPHAIQAILHGGGVCCPK